MPNTVPHVPFFASAGSDCCSSVAARTLDSARVTATTVLGGESLPCGHMNPDLCQRDRTLKQSARDSSLADGSTASSPVDGSPSIDYLPDELLLQIFSYMSLCENINVLQQVCTRWQTLAQDAQLWYDKEYVISESTSEESAVATFRAAPQLRTVIVEKAVSSAVFEALSENCHNLTTLDTRFQMMTPSEAKKLFGSCKQIQSLRITELALLTDRRFTEAVAQLSQLRVLQLKTYRDMGLVFRLDLLADGCPHLVELDLGHARYLVRDAEHFVSSRKNPLKRLSVRWTSTERKCIVPLLSTCAESLEHLHLKCYNVPDDEAAGSFTALGQLHNLQELIFDTVHERASHVAPLAFRNGGLSKLELLCLWCIRAVGNETVVALSEGCPRLRELSLVACDGLTAAAFRSLHRLEQLEKLKISSCGWLDREAVDYISKLPALHTLHFHSVRFESLEPGMECFLNMSGLRHLYLSDSTCWSIPFGRFPGRLTNLRELHIVQCEGDQGQVDEMCIRMPELHVEGVFQPLSTDGVW